MTTRLRVLGNNLNTNKGNNNTSHEDYSIVQITHRDGNCYKQQTIITVDLTISLKHFCRAKLYINALIIGIHTCSSVSVLAYLKDCSDANCPPKREA